MSNMSILSLSEIGVIVEKAVIELVSVSEVFSAFDVTKKVRDEQGGHVARHAVIRSNVHNMFDMSEMPNSYDRELITLEVGDEDVNAFVYFTDSKSAYDHPLAKSQSVAVAVDDSGVPTLDLDGLDSDDTDDTDYCNGDCANCEDDLPDAVGVVATVKVTGKHRIQIPKKVLRNLTVNNGAYNIDVNGSFVVRKAEADGRVRITEPSFPAESTLNLSIKNNTVHISPA